MSNKLVKAWIYRDFTGCYLGGLYINNQVSPISGTNSFESTKLDLIKKAQLKNLSVSMVIEYATFSEVVKNKEA